MHRHDQSIVVVPALTLLQIVPSLAGGGLARATLEAAQAAIAADGASIVASPNGAMVPVLLRQRSLHVEIPEGRGPLMARLILPAKLSAGLRDAGIKVVQARSPATAWVARAVARRLGAKWIATLHAPFMAEGAKDRFIEGRQTRADAVIAVSEHVASDAVARFPALAEKLVTISPGVNLDRFDPAVVRADRLIRLATELRVPDGSHVILCPTRFTEDRGQKLLVEAIRLLGRDDVFCLLLGATGQSTPFEKEVERAIEAAGLGGRMQIGPYVDDMPAAYMLADVVVALGGPREGFSRTMIEAQAMGRPVVAEDGGGAAETMRAGVTGWLAPAGNAAEMAQALETALSLSAPRRAELARAAQDHVRTRYALAESNSKLVEIYQRLLEKTS
jgi:glycosyltransferase involved in cell wall biosynthesis